jgi:hypothetical protein
MSEPAWRQVYDAAEREITPRVEAVVHSEPFAVAAGMLTQLQGALREQATRNTRRWLHLFNLPAGTDITRILAEIGQLRQEVRALTRERERERARPLVAKRTADGGG